MSEHESLVEAILDEPEDNTRRLIYADWLEEHGSFADGVRANLIRLETRIHGKQSSEEKNRLKEEIKALEARYTWLMVPSLPPGFERPRVDRGIVYINVSLAVPRFIEWGEDYLRGLPPYCRLRLRLNRSPGKGKLLTLLDSPAWARVYEFLMWKDYDFSKESGDFMGHPGLRGLEELMLSGKGIGDEALRRLAESPHPLRLREIILWGASASDVGLDAIANGGLPQLRDLRIDQGEITADAIERFQRKRPKVSLTLG